MSKTDKPRIKKASLACNSCRRKKQKCSGLPAPCTACSILETTCCFDETLDRRRRDSRRSQVDLEMRSIALKQILSLLRTNDAAELCRIAQRVEQGQSDTELLSAIINDACSRGSQHLSGKYHNFAASQNSSTDTDKSVGSCESLLDFEPKLESAPSELPLYQEEPMLMRIAPTRPEFVPPHRSTIQPKIPTMASDLGTEFFEYLADMVTVYQVTNQVSPSHSPDLLSTQSNEAMVRMMSDFRRTAQQSIAQHSNIFSVIGPREPDLTLFFRERTIADAHSVWNWACELAKSYKFLSLSMQLSVLYFAGMQMRFLVHPCKETFEELPEMLRSSMQHPGRFGTFPMDPWQMPQIRMHMADQFSLWGPAQHEIEQHCNWPYSNEACLNASDRSRCPVMSQAFLEHITSPRNWTNGHNKFVSPSMGRIGVPAEM